MFSLIIPRLRDGVDRGPRPVTSTRQILLVALIVIIGGYPIGRWIVDKVFTHFADSTALAVMVDKTLIDAVKAQNLALKTQSQAAIDHLDRQWIEERKNPAAALTGAMLASGPSQRLQALLAGSHGAVTHAILMDEKGRNVAIAAPTTDYWQGDEAKFLDTVAKASHEVNRGDLEFRHDAREPACWLSRTIFEGGKPIGALAVEVNLKHVPPTICAQTP